jgi:ubiquinone/menaquinone biosynthesis C-methylase UbiE
MERQDDTIRALIELHRGLERQGPGDEAFSKQMLSMLPELPVTPRIADLGCGAGAGALMLAEHFQVQVTAVDFSEPFLEELRGRARKRGVDHLIRTVKADMGALEWPPAALDLLWSEGAAYNLSFEGALKAWRPLIAPGGIAVVSEITWFADDIPQEASSYWKAAYPHIAGETENAGRAGAAGFEVLGIHRLPSRAWWENYYEPLMQRMDTLRKSADATMSEVLSETDAEIEMFRKYQNVYGYAFYLLKSA